MVQKQPTVGVIGYGFVGKATVELELVTKVNIYDPYVEQYKSYEDKKNAFSSDIVIVCVPTPEGKDGKVDLSILDKTVESFFDFCTGSNILVIKSTIPAGTVDNYCNKYKYGQILHNPEFLTERTHIQDFRNPTDIVIGGEHKSCKKLADLYRQFYFDLNSGFNCIDINICSAIEAELLKTVRNSFYAAKVIFMNEVYQFANALGIDYNSFEKVLTNNGKHPWWGPEHTKVPGHDGSLGYGGKCFIKDTAGLLALAKTYNIDLDVLKAAFDKNIKIRNHIDIQHHKGK